ncbi:YfeC-like transcriptional regulator [Pantoea agglomerans]
MMKKEWLTPEELASETGLSRQTVNKWIRPPCPDPAFRAARRD